MPGRAVCIDSNAVRIVGISACPIAGSIDRKASSHIDHGVRRGHDEVHGCVGDPSQVPGVTGEESRVVFTSAGSAG